MLTSLAIGRGGLGRMGNQMFTIAGVIGIAIKSGQPFGFPKWKNYDNAVFGDEVTDFSEVFVNPLPEDRGLPFSDYGYFWGYRDINLPSGNWSIDAHLQDERYFKHCIDTVRHYFTMKEEGPHKEAVAIHFRCGDYTEGIDTYHPRQPKEYYEKAMAIFPGERFIVFSDDIPAAKLMFGESVDYSIGDYITDFRLMKRCKSFIIANSSYSLMASILGEHPEKRIVAPALWFGKVADLEFSGYPENSIVI